MLTFLQEPGLVHDQHAVRIAERRARVVAHSIAQRLGLPAAAPEQRLHAIWPFGAGLLGHQPAGLAGDPGEQSVEEGGAGFFQLTPAENRREQILQSRELVLPSEQAARPNRHRHALASSKRTGQNRSIGRFATVVLERIQADWK
jgi:hypothetical protein